MSDLIAVLRAHAAQNQAATLDSTSTQKKDPEDNITLDSAANYALTSIASEAIAALHQWAETSDLDDGETLADRLVSLMVGIADANKDGELDDDEQDVVETALEAAWDYLASLGVSESDISALLNDWDDNAANNILDLVATSLPEGEDSADAAIDAFVFGDKDQGAVFDATYAKRMVVRNGKKTRINKRISGTVRLSAKQKIAVKKMLMKSHSSKSKARRMRSMKIRKNGNF